MGQKNIYIWDKITLELSDVEIGSLPEKKFRVMSVKVIKELGRECMHSLTFRVRT